MKSILEQDFDELYAQVEARVKCIKPVKQIDTFTKALMWTSLNEILMDVFGGSRFMWLIEIFDNKFVVKFADRYRSADVQSLTVPYMTEFVWPSEHELRNMTYTELEMFRRQCSDINLTMVDISRRYRRNDTWFKGMMKLRQQNAAPAGTDMAKLRHSRGQTASWSDDELNDHLLVYELFKRTIPISENVLGQMIPDPKRVRGLRPSCTRKSTKSWTNCSGERMLIVLNKILQYINLALKSLHNNDRVFVGQRCVDTSGYSKKNRKKILIEYLENKKVSIETEITQTTLSIKPTKEVEND